MRQDVVCGRGGVAEIKQPVANEALSENTAENCKQEKQGYHPAQKTWILDHDVRYGYEREMVHAKTRLEAEGRRSRQEAPKALNAMETDRRLLKRS